MAKSEIVVVDHKVYHLGLKKGQLAPNIFLVGDPARSYKVAAYFDEVKHEVKNREYVTITGTFEGLPVSVIGTGIGTDNVEIALTEILTVHEFDFITHERLVSHKPLNLIRIGTSGGVQEDIAGGTLGIASYGLGLDNTGLYYDHPVVDPQISLIEKVAFRILTEASPENTRFRAKIIPYASKASPEVVRSLVNEAENLGLSNVIGITASTPGFYGPSARYIDGLINTIPNIKHHLAQLDVNGHRVINMEMESSILFHICQKLKYRAGTICAIISNPKTSASLINYNEVIDGAIRTALGAMKNLVLRN